MPERSMALESPGRGRFFGAALGLVGAVALSILSAAAYLSAVRWVDHTIEVREEAASWLAIVLSAQIAARDVVLSQDPALIEQYGRAREKIRVKAARIRDLVSDNPGQVRNVDAGAEHAAALTRHLDTLVDLVKEGRVGEVVGRLAVATEDANLETFRGDVHRIRGEEDRLLGERRARATFRASLTALGILLLILASSSLLVIGRRDQAEYQRTLREQAARARDRLAKLSDLAAALAESRTQAQVTAAVVTHGAKAAGADTFTLHMVDEGGRALELVGDHGVAPEIVERIRRIADGSKDPQIFDAWKANVATWAESDHDYVELQPTLATMQQRRARAFWSVPLVAEERAVGLLGAGFREPRRFSADERVFVETLARQCAQALVRAMRMESEDEAREWLATTLRSIGDAVIATDAEGKVRFMNSVAESLTGWSQDEARGRPLHEVFAIFSERTREPVESPVTKVLREGKVVGLANHTVLRSKRGLELPIDDSGAPIRSDGQVRGVVLVFRDASEETRSRVRSDFLASAGEALGASLDYEVTLATVARLAVPTIADWCSVTLALQGQPGARQVAIAHVDPEKVALARELGERYPPDPNATTGVPQVLRTGQSELYAEIPSRLLERGARDEEHLRIIRDLRLESAMVVPLRAHGSTFGAMTFIYADSGRRYTESDLAFAEDFARRAAMAIENALALKDAQEARRSERWLRDQAEAASSAKDEFLATVSHELRTPLNAILGWSVTLRSGGPSSNVERGLATIERNARAQARLIEDILDVSRIVSGKLALDLRSTRIADAIHAAVQTVAPAAAAKGIAIQTEIADDSLAIVADPDRVQQIVWNLLSNAVKFTPKGGQVHVEMAREGSELRLQVRDTGEGIEPSVLPHIFDRFRQADSSTMRRHGGLGLGLALVKQLAIAHGGSVRAESEGSGKGATVVVRIPARAAVPALTVQTNAVTSRWAVPVDFGPRLDGLRVLVVDDEPDAREIVGEILRALGAHVELAPSVAEAFERFRVTRPDVIISDIGMPDADGFQLIRMIRAMPLESGGATPAVALTAYARRDDATRVLAAGYQVHVAKPIEPMYLATVVAELAHTTRRRNEPPPKEPRV